MKRYYIDLKNQVQVYKINVFIVISKTTFWKNVTMGKEGVLYMEEAFVEVWTNECVWGKRRSRKQISEGLHLSVIFWGRWGLGFCKIIKGKCHLQCRGNFRKKTKIPN